MNYHSRGMAFARHVPKPRVYTWIVFHEPTDTVISKHTTKALALKKAESMGLDYMIVPVKPEQ